MDLALMLGGWHWHWDFGFPWRLAWLGTVLRAVVHVGLAYYVLRDARGRSPLLFGTPAWFWGAIVLLSGVWGALAYWVANCSTFVREHTVGTGPERGPERTEGS